MYINRLTADNILNTTTTTSQPKHPYSTTGSDRNSVVNDVVSNNIDTVSNIAKKYDVTNISPRDMANLSGELYQTGNITFKQHAMLSFQIELNPSYDSTIGKLTGKVSQPDTSRNFLSEWQDKLEHSVRTHMPVEMIQLNKECVSILENLDALRSSLLS